MEKVRKSVNENGNEPLVRRYDRRSRGIGSNVSNLTEILSDSLSLSIKRVLFAIVLRKRDRKNGQMKIQFSMRTQTHKHDAKTDKHMSLDRLVKMWNLSKLKFAR